jgi:mannose/fructose/N-acetylgalactosamine-specific phosphotransferase system component IID
VVERTSVSPAGERTLTAKDVRASWLRWFLFAQASYSWERLQGTGFVLAMIPIIKRLWKTREEQIQALQRHLFFYNTEPTWGAVITGAAAAMEEQAAQSAAQSGEAVLDNDTFNSVKTGLMGPLAGFGDTIDQGTITPILLALGISLTKAGTVLGPVLYMILEGIWIVGVSYTMYMIGFTQGRNGIRSVLSSGALDQVTEGARLLGGIVLGGLAATYISLSTNLTVKIGPATTPLQTGVLNQLLPGLLPLALVIAVWALLQRRVHPTWMMVMLLAFGLLGGITGWWQ